MKSPNEWFNEFARNAYNEGLPVESELCELFLNGLAIKNDTRLQMSKYRRARAIAERIGNRRAVLMIDHWCIQCMLGDEFDADRVLQLVVPAVVEVRQTIFDDFPQRFCLQEDLIHAYMDIDPIGHSQAISDALEYFRLNVPRDLACYCCYRNLETDFKVAQCKLDEAWEHQLEVLSDAQSIPAAEDNFNRTHYSTIAARRLCKIAALQEDWESVLEYATLGEPLAKERDRQDDHKTFQHWRAAALRILGQEAEAQQCFRQARRRRSNPPTSTAYFDAVSAYHVHGSKPHLAWKARCTQLELLQRKGWFWSECHCRLERCKLAKQMKKPDLLQTETEALRTIAANLKQPQVITDKLDELLKDE